MGIVKEKPEADQLRKKNRPQPHHERNALKQVPSQNVVEDQQPFQIVVNRRLFIIEPEAVGKKISQFIRPFDIPADQYSPSQQTGRGFGRIIGPFGHRIQTVDPLVRPSFSEKDISDLPDLIPEETQAQGGRGVFGDIFVGRAFRPAPGLRPDKEFPVSGQPVHDRFTLLSIEIKRVFSHGDDLTDTVDIFAYVMPHNRDRHTHTRMSVEIQGYLGKIPDIFQTLMLVGIEEGGNLADEIRRDHGLGIPFTGILGFLTPYPDGKYLVGNHRPQ